VLHTPARPESGFPEELLSVAALPPGRSGDVVVRVRGEVDTFTAPLLRACLRTQVMRPAVAELVVDLREVTFMGAAGVGALALARRWCHEGGVRFRVRAGKQHRVLALTGFADLLAPDAGRRPGSGGRRPGRRLPRRRARACL